MLGLFVPRVLTRLASKLPAPLPVPKWQVRKYIIFDLRFESAKETGFWF
jgi:hypothetical protein